MPEIHVHVMHNGSSNFVNSVNLFSVESKDLKSFIGEHQFFPIVKIFNCYNSLQYKCLKISPEARQIGRLGVNRYRRKRPKVDASIFDSALSLTRRSEASKKGKKIACPLLDVFACGQVSSPRLYRLRFFYLRDCRIIVWIIRYKQLFH